MKFCKVHMKMNHQDSNKRMYISQGILKHYMKAEYQITYFSSPYSVQNNMLPIAILMFLIMKNGIEMFRTAGDGHTRRQPQHLADRGRRMKGQGHSGLRNVWLGGRSRSPGSHIKYRARKIKPQGGEYSSVAQPLLSMHEALGLFSTIAKRSHFCFDWWYSSEVEPLPRAGQTWGLRLRIINKKKKIWKVNQ